jgi:hypothetical protein
MIQCGYRGHISRAMYSFSTKLPDLGLLDYIVPLFTNSRRP